MSEGHVPVLAAELVAALDPQRGQTAVDCTFGAGGHARLVAEHLGDEGLLIAIDRDPVAATEFQAFTAQAPSQAKLIEADFETGLTEIGTWYRDTRYLGEESGALEDRGTWTIGEESGEIGRPDLIYMDLGISSMQVDTRERGFSYSYDAPLDMRMDPEQELSAQTIANSWEQKDIVRILRHYGEERFANRIGAEIVRRRVDKPFTTTFELVDAVRTAVPTPAQFGGGHPAKRTFQAFRIAVNDELGQLERALPLAWELLPIGGRLGVISFHSLEDRMVKRFFADLSHGCTCPPDFPICICGQESTAALLARRAVMPSQGEIEANPRSKSARLRAARKLGERG